MEINMTLLVQMVHFYAVYWLLDRMVMRYAIAIVRKEDAERSLREHVVAVQQQKVDDLLIQNEQNWQVLQKRLVTEGPVLNEVAAKPVVVTVANKPLSEDEVAANTQAMAKEIVARLRV